MFLQETKTKRGGKTYVSYLVRESFRTPSGPRGRTICNVTHLPKAVRDLVGVALKGKPFVPLEQIHLDNVHSFGGCAVLEDAGRRYGLPAILEPLSPRNRSLIQAMVFGGLLFSPSIAPFYVESRSTRLAMFCGLDPENERFDLADLHAALAELDTAWPRISEALLEASRATIRALCFFRNAPSQGGDRTLGVLAMDAAGVPVPFSIQTRDSEPLELETLLSRVGDQEGPLLLVLDEETAEHMEPAALAAQGCVIELTPASAAGLQLSHPPGGSPTELRHEGRRYLLAPATGRLEAGAPGENMASLKELGAMAQPLARVILTTGAAEALPPPMALEWADRALEIRRAFCPVHIVIGSTEANGEGIGTWRNHQHLQFLTHRLRCQLHAEWQARGENRPVEEVLRDLQEIYRGTLVVNDAQVLSLPPRVSKAAADLLAKLELWPLFQSAGKC